MSNKIIHQLYIEHQGKVSDKWTLYLNEYDRLFNDYRDKPVRLLEIGIQNGGSLDIWSKYFSNAAALIGCDINPDCARLSYDDPRISVIVGDANAPEVRERVFQRSPQFDIIIDDGSHLSSDIVKSFALYFQRVVEGGIFIAEDLHCSYWSEFEGGLFDPYSSISFFKRLADIISHEHWGIPKSRADILRGIFTKYGCEIDEESLAQVHSVEFINSMCVVRKAPAADNRLGRRFIAGSLEIVVSGHRELHGYPYQLDPFFNQSGNPWSARETPPDEVTQYMELAVVNAQQRMASLSQTLGEREEQLVSLGITLSERDSQVISLNQAVAERDGVIHQILSSTSWRLTLPLRKVKMFLKNNTRSMNNTDASGIRPILIRNIRRAKLLRIILPVALSRSGGIRRTISKAWAVFKREGWSGIKHRVIFLHSQVTRPSGEIIALNRNDHVEFSCRDGIITDETRATMLKRIDTLKFQPLISVVVPTFNPKPEWLKKAIESVRKQVYPHWELCIADDASTDENIRPILQHYASTDMRIKVVFLEKNSGISAASNSALAIATGEFVALLDHDDELSPDALYWVIEEICAHPEAEVIYSDEDKITPDGSHTDIFFKPDWSPELLYNCMYIGHLTVYKKSLINQVGGFRTKYDFSQDYDLALRATEVAHTVRHIPRILYHWRQADGSSSQGGKPYARISNLAALQDAVDRRGLTAQVIDLPTANRAKIIGWQPKISIVIPTDSEVNLVACLDAISEKTSYPSWEIVVVTNSKLVGRLAQRYARLPLSFCRYDKPYNFSDKCNEGADQATGEVVVFFNDDVRPLSDGWLEDLVELLAVPEVGAVAPKLLYENRQIQYAGMVTGVRGLVGTAFHCRPENTTEYFNFAQSVRDVSVVSGACMAMRRSDFLGVGGFDAINTPIMHSDVDLSFKVREKGLRCVYTPYATLLHIGHQSLKEHDKKQTKADQDKSDIYLLKRWGSYVTYDPYFPDNMRGLLYHDSPEPILMWGQNRPDLLKNHTDILIVSHDMSASGAPMIAYHAAKHLLASGAFPVVASPEDGPMRALFIALGIPVIIDPLLLKRHESVKKLARNFDCVLANTVGSWPIVYQLLEEQVPVMWYLHESNLIPHLAEINPLVAATLRKAQHVYSGSERAASFCQPFNQDVKILTYGVPDIYCDENKPVDLKAPLVFSVFGTIEPRKGQDIFLEAVRLVGNRADGKVIFNLIGRTLDEGWVTELRKIAEDLENVFFLGEVDHHQYLNLMGESHVIVCPSRDDTLPLVTLDALCLGKMLICTNTTGTSNFMTNGKDGLVVPSADPEALADAIVSLIENTTRHASMGAEGRQTFLRHFAEDKFAERLVDEVRGLTRINTSANLY